MSFTERVQVGRGSRGIEFERPSTEDTDAVWTFHWSLFLHFLRISSNTISARYTWHRHGFFLRTNECGISLGHQICREIAIECTNRLRDLWVRTIAYVESLFHCLFPFPLFFLLYCLWQSRRSARRERDRGQSLHILTLCCVQDPEYCCPTSRKAWVWIYIYHTVFFNSFCSSFHLLVSIFWAEFAFCIPESCSSDRLLDYGTRNSTPWSSIRNTTIPALSAIKTRNKFTSTWGTYSK